MRTEAHRAGASGSVRCTCSAYRPFVHRQSAVLAPQCLKQDRVLKSFAVPHSPPMRMDVLDLLCKEAADADRDFLREEGYVY